MTKSVYNKLVRDKIPERINSSTLTTCVHKLIDGDELFKALMDKLIEEVTEFSDNPCVEELGDVYDVVQSLILQFGQEEFKKQQSKKIESHGGFEKGVYLEWVELK